MISAYFRAFSPIIIPLVITHTYSISKPVSSLLQNVNNLLKHGSIVVFREDTIESPDKNWQARQLLANEELSTISPAPKGYRYTPK